MRRTRRLGAAVLLVALGRLLSPTAVPVYDGVSAPDEPYRYVQPPRGAQATAAPTEGLASTPVAAGRSSYGMSVTSAEQGPQFSLFVPPGALAAAAGPVRVRAVPLAPSDQPVGARIDGNVYLVTLSAGGGPVTLTDQASLATLYLRATTARQPPPVMEHRSSRTDAWTALKTSRGGADVYVSSFVGAGEYALAFTTQAAHGGGLGAPYVVLGVVLLLAVVVVVVRLRAAG